MCKQCKFSSPGREAPSGVNIRRLPAFKFLLQCETNLILSVHYRLAASTSQIVQDETNLSSVCRDSFRPALQVGLPQRWRFAVQWLADPAGLLVAEDEGALRWTSLDPFFRKERMPVNSMFECAPFTALILRTGNCWDFDILHSLDLTFWRVRMTAHSLSKCSIPCFSICQP